MIARLVEIGDPPLADRLAGAAFDLAETAAGAEQRRLDRRAAEAEALADLAVGEALELTHDEDLVVGVRQAAERAAEVVETLHRVARDRIVIMISHRPEALAGVATVLRLDAGHLEMSTR